MPATPRRLLSSAAKRGASIWRPWAKASHNPRGFVPTTVLGIVGSVVATFLCRTIHLYGPDQSADIIASIVGALIVLWGWHMLAVETLNDWETFLATTAHPLKGSR